MKTNLTLDSTLTECVDAYLAQNTRITSPQTGRRYRTAVNAFRRCLGREPIVSDLTAEAYVAWMTARREQVRPSTVRGECEKLRVIWRWLGKVGVTEWPDVDLPPAVRETPTTFTDDEMARLWKAAERCGWNVGGVPGSVYWPALLSVLYETAERINAVHQVEWADIDLAGCQILFRAETRKGRRADNLATISRSTRRKLKGLQAYNGGCRPFGHLGLAAVRWHYNRLLVDARVDHHRRKKFHGLRSRAASDVAAAGGDATMLLTHSSPEVTYRSYLDPKIVQRVSPLKLLRRWGVGRRLGLLRLFGL